jgi:hypothetical protein
MISISLIYFEISNISENNRNNVSLTSISLIYFGISTFLKTIEIMSA